VWWLVHKNVHVLFYNNFDKCERILIIISLSHSQMNCRKSWNKVYHFTSNLMLHQVGKLNVQHYNIHVHVHTECRYDAKSYIYCNCDVKFYFVWLHRLIYASTAARWRGCVYVLHLQMFFCPFLFFSVFSVRHHKIYETTVLGNGWTNFHETFTKR